MRLLGRLRERGRSVASITTVSVLSTALVAVALQYRGEPTAKVEVNDSGVWVTRSVGASVARFNDAAQALDATLVAGSRSADVLQQGTNVVVVDPTGATVSPVDVADARFVGAGKLPADAQVALGGAAVAVLDADDGHLWVVPVASVGAFDREETPVTRDVKPGAALAAGLDGRIHVAQPGGDLLTLTTTENGGVDTVSTRHLDGVGDRDELAVTAVGGDAVVLDTTTATLHLPDGRTAKVEGADAVLQQSGGRAASVAYATPSGLVQQPLDGGAPVTHPGSGRPVAPVQVAGCTYGAWSGTGLVVRDCADDARDLQQTVDGVDREATLRYRVNRDVVVLNDLSSGTLWRATDTFQLVKAFERKIPKQSKGDPSEAETTTPEQVDQPVAANRERNRPPKAADDSFGVRPGRSTVLPVLGNDVDPDGDVMSAAVVGDGPQGIDVAPAVDGAALLATTPDDASGSRSFRYQVTDGRGGKDQASVRLKVSPWGTNGAPEQSGEPVLQVEKGGSGEIKVLPYFRDPDGDDLYLADAQAKVRGDEVRSRPDGTVMFSDQGTSTGRKAVSLTVSDGMGGSVEGTLWIEVLAPGPRPPVAVGDRATTTVGQPVTVAPLANDTDPNGDELRLANVEQPDGAKITTNTAAGTFQLVSERAGTYVFTYQVTDGPSSSVGVVRVDVLADSSSDAPPVAVPDTALLPSGGEVLVDVLANDTDPAGGVLVVQGVQVPKGAGVTVAVLGHSVLRITQSKDVNEPITLTYTVSNGTASSRGQVRVVPVPPPNRLQPPHAVDDRVTVRVGDVVTVPVLANDTHPDGLKLLLQPQLAQKVEAGDAFVAGETVRYLAPAKAGTYHTIYRVRDKNGQEDSAQVTFRVVDGTENQPPRPPALTARTFAGASVKITVPLDGTDPDGDSVRLTGIGRAPGKGTAKVTAGTIVYSAAKGSRGTDTFAYTVEDARGESATGTVEIGIAPVPQTNQPPVAVDDRVQVRPGRSVAVPVLANDSDPDGDRIALVRGATEEAGVRAEVVGERIAFTSPQTEGTSSVIYTIEDTKGARASAALIIETSTTAALLAPVARDDVLSGEDVGDATSVKVPVLDNDDDPDGAASALKVTVAADDVTVGDDGVVTVPLTTSPRTVLYTVTDPDGLTAKAFVRVPGVQVDKPTLRLDAKPLEVRQGEKLSVDVRDFVRVSDGRSVRITEERSVTAVSGSRTVPDEHTIVFTPAPDYVGQAAVSFEVTDGKGPDDPDGTKGTFTLPITVLPAKNQAPELSTAQAQVASGEDASIDLARFATDADGDPLTFTVGRGPAGLTAALSGSTVALTATPELTKGQTVELPITVTDGKHDPVSSTLSVDVVASTRPLARAVDDTVAKAPQGKELRIPVTANDVNPFAAEGKPLTVVGAVVEAGLASTPLIDGGTVVLTPDPDFHGQISVRYTVQDATKDRDRQVTGRATITVQGKPDAPATPKVTEVRSGTVVLDWSPPANNGADITGYAVRSASGPAFEQQCSTTTCTLTGLTNDQEYTFVVTATNEVGESDASPESEVARPDQKPDAPGAPTLEFGDGELTVTWTQDTYTDRSPIESYNLQISPAPANGVTQVAVPLGGTYTWKGLSNGTAYTVSVQALNRAPDPSDWSAPSAPETPAGKPAAPGAPTVERTSLGAQSQMRVSWTPPNDNGGPITGYEVRELRGGEQVTVVTASGDATSQTLDVDASTTDYTFQVRAKNRATEKFGDADWSAQSATVRAYAAPPAPTGLKATATGNDGQVKLTYTGVKAAGVRDSEISYQYTRGNGWAALPADGLVGGLGNGTDYTFQVRAVATVDGTSTAGAESGSASANPYGPIPKPWIRAEGGDRKVSFRWESSGNGRSYTTTLSGDASGTVAASGSTTVGAGYSESRRVCVTVTDTEGQSKDACAEDTSKEKPKPTVTVGRGGSVSNGDCNDGTCAYLRLTVSGADPNTEFAVKCYSSDGGDHQFAPTDGGWGSTAFSPRARYKTDGNGSWSGDAWCFHGKGGRGVQLWIETNKFGTSPRVSW